MAQPSRIFRVFVSSTFADLRNERRALQRLVFPRLAELCREHGARFQAVDLRWGVSEEAAVDQQTMNVCLQELARCQEVTPRPNFVVLLGERYGWRPLPPQIPAEEFEAILARVDRNERGLLEWRPEQAEGNKGWYRRDENAVPAEYLLQPRRGECVDPGRWGEMEQRLRTSLLAAVASMDIPEAARARYEDSATEQEITAGALCAGTRHAFCYFRTIDGLPEGSAAGVYRDVDESGKTDAAAAAQIIGLQERLRQALQPEQVHEYRATWDADSGGPNGDHLDALCEQVWDDLSGVILEELARPETADELEQEIAAHGAFGRSRSECFTGRLEPVERIAAYVREGDGLPLILAGEGGSGKSTLMAHSAARAQATQPGAVVVTRFIGATPDSTDVRQLLQSLCEELARKGIGGAEVPDEFRGLVEDFERRLREASAERPVILFLDALDQFGPDLEAHHLAWLPREVPEGVRIVMSALLVPGSESVCLELAQSRYPEAAVVRLPGMTAGEMDTLLGRWLSRARRTLQAEQREDVLAKGACCPLPLYLKLAFEEARRWTSYDGLPSRAGEEPGLSDTVEGVIGDLLVRLSQPSNHGETLVTQTLTYLAAAWHGLTEDELLELLGLDERVMVEVRRRSYWQPETKGLPVVLWARLHAELGPYLAERSGDHTRLLAFHHRQVWEVVAARYLTGHARAVAHTTLADYFGEQRLMYRGENGRLRPNYRRASEHPYHLAHAARTQELIQHLGDWRLQLATMGTGDSRSGVRVGVEHSNAAEALEDLEAEIGPLDAADPRVAEALDRVYRKADTQGGFDLHVGELLARAMRSTLYWMLGTIVGGLLMEGGGVERATHAPLYGALLALPFVAAEVWGFMAPAWSRTHGLLPRWDMWWALAILGYMVGVPVALPWPIEALWSLLPGYSFHPAWVGAKTTCLLVVQSLVVPCYVRLYWGDQTNTRRLMRRLNLAASVLLLAPAIVGAALLPLVQTAVTIAALRAWLRQVRRRQRPATRDREAGGRTGG